MDYISIKEAARLWGIDTSRIGKLAREGRIDGAKIVGRNWLIPRNAKKPQDGRTKYAKEMIKSDFFRFPLYINSEESAFSPPLTEEELFLKNAQFDYYACNFDSSKKAFEGLLNSAENVYIKVMALFYLCSLSVEVYGGEGFTEYYANILLELTKDFAHKKEIELVIPWLYTITVQNQAVSDSLIIDPLYDYSPTVQPLISLLSFYHFSKTDPALISKIHLDVYEMVCRQLLQNGNYYEACELHFLLFLAYYVSAKEEAMLYHLRKGLSLVKERKLYIIAASYLHYYRNAFDIVLCEFSEEFVNTLRDYSDIISNSIGIFAEKHSITEIYSTLSENDYRYLMLAYQGKTNNQVSLIMHVSMRTVAKRYNEIYNKLGVEGKQELIEKLNASFSDNKK